MLGGRLRAGKPRSREAIDDRDVEGAIATRFQADRGFVVLNGVRGSSIDPSARDGFTSKMGIHATKPLGGDPAMLDKTTLWPRRADYQPLPVLAYKACEAGSALQLGVETNDFRKFSTLPCETNHGVREAFARQLVSMEHSVCRVGEADCFRHLCACIDAQIPRRLSRLGEGRETAPVGLAGETSTEKRVGEVSAMFDKMTW